MTKVERIKEIIKAGGIDHTSLAELYRKVAIILTKETTPTAASYVKKVYLAHKSTLKEYVNCRSHHAVMPEGDKAKSYKVLENRYVWHTTKGTIDLPVEYIDSLFYQYSEHGLDKSQQEIISDNNLDVWQWNTIKNRLRLFKASNVFSPYTVEQTPSEQLEGMVDVKIQEKFKDVGNIVKRRYDSRLRHLQKKSVDNHTIKENFHEIIYSELHELLPKAEFVGGVPVKDSGNGVIVVTLADLHMGARTEKLLRTRDFSPQILEGMVLKAATEINKLDAREVHLSFLGDYIESFTGKMHPDQFRSLEYAYVGAEVVIKAAELITMLISKVNNVKKVYAVPGNHDRLHEDAKFDPQGEIGRLIFHIVKQNMGHLVDVRFEYSVLSEVIDGISYVFMHGHHRKDKAPAEATINRYGDSNYYNLVLTGHLHSHIVFEDCDRYQRKAVRSFFPGNHYSEELGFTSQPSIHIFSNEGGKPKEIIIPI